MTDKTMNRIDHSIRNVKFAVIGQLLSITLSFISRTIFVRILGSEYLGLNGLFTNISSVLSLVELGFGSAIVYSMYKPFAENDSEKIRSLLALYRKTYLLLGTVIAIIGGAFTPFVKHLIKDIPDLPYINQIYLLFVAMTALSYLFSYNRSLFIADQKKYIDSIFYFGFLSLSTVIQIIFLFLTKNYIVYLVIRVVAILLDNGLITIKVYKKYPFIRSKKPVHKLTLEDKYVLSKNIKALFMHRIGTVVITGTSSIIISKFIGLVAVGLYSNYQMITQALVLLLNMVFQSVTPSIGNLGVTENKATIHGVFCHLNFICYWLFSFSSISLFVLLNPFITIWLGDSFVFSNEIVLLIVLLFYQQGLRNSIMTFRDALGLFWYDRYKPVLEATLNLIISIILVQKIGIMGVILGTILSTFLSGFWIESYVLFRHGFDMHPASYYKDYFVKLVLLFVIGSITYLVCLVPISNAYLAFVYKAFACLVIPNGAIVVLYAKTSEFAFTKTIVKGFLAKGVER
ncbi:MAG: oligosaccharide flippase family protein [Clostridiales bacterium]|nr:oligosaccharide flippase family protein [Clostridiales bacterium]